MKYADIAIPAPPKYNEEIVIPAPPKETFVQHATKELFSKHVTKNQNDKQSEKT